MPALRWSLAGLFAFALLIEATAAIAQNAPGFTNVEVWTPGVAAQSGYDKTFPAPPAPLRSLGGATSFATAGVVIIPTSKDGEKSDFQVSLAHGLQTLQFVNVIEDRSADPRCSGGGTGFGDPVVADTKSKLHPIEAVLRCALALRPGSHWLSSHLITDDDDYVSVIQVKMADGQTALIYASVTDWAEDVAD